MIPELAYILLLFYIVNAVMAAVFVTNNLLLANLLLNIKSISITLLLVFFLISNDFSVNYVMQHSNSRLPVYYTIASLWAGHSGSIMLLIFFQSVLSILLFNFIYRGLIHNSMLRLDLLSKSALYTYLVVYANPFARELPDLPIDGNDLNPLLQDLSMTYHPPIFFLGIALLYVIWLLQVSSVLKPIRAINNVAWWFLTLGILLGARWAYTELGWGGYWFWDPVENLSLIPWILTSITMHQFSSGSKLATASSLAYPCFLLGTYFTRTGSLDSVHAFNDGNIVWPLFFLGSFKLLIVFRAIWSNKASSSYKYTDFQAALFILWAICILVGTFAPLVYFILTKQKITLASQFFSSTTELLVIIMLSLLLYYYARARLYLLVPLLLVLGCYFSILNTLLLGISILILVVLPFTKTTNAFAKLSHISFSIITIGIVLSGVFQKEYDLAVPVATPIVMNGYQLNLNDPIKFSHDNYLGTEFPTDLIFSEDSYQLYPRRQIYIANKLPATKADRVSRNFTDYIIIVSEQLSEQKYLVKFLEKPFIMFLWIGGFLLVAGGVNVFRKKNWRS